MRRRSSERTSLDDARPDEGEERRPDEGPRDDPAGSDLSLSELLGEYQLPAGPAEGGAGAAPLDPLERIDGERGETGHEEGEAERA